MFKAKYLVNEWELALLVEDGKIRRKLKPGLYKIKSASGRKRIEVRDARIRLVRAGFGEEFRTADDMMITPNIQIPLKLVDIRKAISEASNPDEIIRNWTTQYMGKKISELTIDEAMTQQTMLGEMLTEYLTPKVADLGDEVADVCNINLTVPRSLRRSFEAVMSSKKKAMADLEEARGKTAVLRHLANSADLIKDNPDLYKLLISQKVRSLNINMDQKS